MCPREAVAPRGKPVLEQAPGLWTPGEEPMVEQLCWQDLGPHRDPSAPEGLHSLEGSHAGAVHDQQPVGRIPTGEVCRGLSQVREPHAGAGKVCEESSP